MINASFPPFGSAPVHSEPADTCAGCQYRALVGQAPARWWYCTLHVTPRSKCIHYDTGAVVPNNRLAGALKCR